MKTRSAHLVGSLPGNTAQEAMTGALDRLAPWLRALPDGETGERRNWIIHIVEAMRDHPDLELVKEGSWSDYQDVPRFRVRKGHRLYGAALDFGELSAAEASWPTFETLRTNSSLPELSFQVGIPGDFDLAMFTLGPAAALRHRRAFAEATVRQIRAIHVLTGERAVFQIEVPAELVLLARAPGPSQPALARILGRQIASLAAGAAPGTRFGIHLCLGDMNHRALGRMTDATPLVLLANAIARAWPADRLLEFVHAPFAAAENPPPLSRAFYAPLRGLRLGPVRFVSGIAHEEQPLADQRRLRALVDEATGQAVDISTSCGLGRRSPDNAYAALDRIAELCQE